MIKYLLLLLVLMCAFGCNTAPVTPLRLESRSELEYDLQHTFPVYLTDSFAVTGGGYEVTYKRQELSGITTYLVVYFDSEGRVIRSMAIGV